MLPKEDGKKIMLGFVEADAGVYHLVMVELETGKWKKAKKFKKMGISLYGSR